MSGECECKKCKDCGNCVECNNEELNLRRAELALSLSQKATARRDFRRNVELRMVFGLWLFLTSATVFSLNVEFRLSPIVLCILAILPSVLHLLVFYFWYLPSNKKDRDDSLKWEKVASQRIIKDAHDEQDDQRLTKEAPNIFCKTIVLIRGKTFCNKSEKDFEKGTFVRGWIASSAMMVTTLFLGLLFIYVVQFVETPKKAYEIDFGSLETNKIKILEREQSEIQSNKVELDMLKELQALKNLLLEQLNSQVKNADEINKLREEVKELQQRVRTQ